MATTVKTIAPYVLIAGLVISVWVSVRLDPEGMQIMPNYIRDNGGRP